MITIVASGGCFWTLQAVLRRIKGVEKTQCAYVMIAGCRRECVVVSAQNDAFERLQKIHGRLFRNQSEDTPAAYKAEFDIDMTSVVLVPASDYDQDFFEQRPDDGYCQSQIVHKLETLATEYPEDFTFSIK